MRKFIFLADSFFPEVVPPEAIINTKLAVKISNRMPVKVYTRDCDNIAHSLSGLAVMRIGGWGILSAFQIACDVIRNGVTDLVLMYDAVGYGRSFVVVCIPLLFRAVRPDLRIVTHFTNNVPIPVGRVWRFLFRKASQGGFSCINERIGFLGLSDRLVFYCEKHKEEMVAGQEELRKKSVVSPVPPTIEFDGHDRAEVTAFRKNYIGSREEFLFCFFGLIYPEKGIDTLFASLSILKNRGVRFRVLIIGNKGEVPGRTGWNKRVSAYYDYLKKAEVELGISEEVFWLGHLDDKDVSAALVSCDVVVLPFRSGVLANNSSFSTCLAHGARIVSTRSADTDHFIIDNRFVRLVRPDSPEELANAMTEVARQSNRARSIRGEIGFTGDLFSWDRFQNVIIG